MLGGAGVADVGNHHAGPLVASPDAPARETSGRLQLLEPDRYWQVVARLRDYCDFLVARGLILLSPLPDRAVPRYQLVTSEAVIEELSRGDFPAREDCLRLIKGLPLVPIEPAVAEIRSHRPIDPVPVFQYPVARQLARRATAPGRAPRLEVSVHPV